MLPFFLHSSQSVLLVKQILPSLGQLSPQLFDFLNDLLVEFFKSFFLKSLLPFHHGLICSIAWQSSCHFCQCMISILSCSSQRAALATPTSCPPCQAKVWNICRCPSPLACSAMCLISIPLLQYPLPNFRFFTILVATAAAHLWPTPHSIAGALLLGTGGFFSGVPYKLMPP